MVRPGAMGTPLTCCDAGGLGSMGVLGAETGAQELDAPRTAFWVWLFEARWATQALRQSRGCRAQ